MTIYVGNLSWDCEQEDLHSLFAEYGAVKKCSLPLDRETGRKRGFGFVDMSSDEEEQKAIDDLRMSNGWAGTSASTKLSRVSPVVDLYLAR